MDARVSLDRTRSGKEHFEVLDGLRGTAAILIVIFHLFRNSTFAVSHAYLAVDFFFALSGFVIAYAYDDRWSRMSILQFYRVRLIRLHPLVLLGATLGMLGYLFDPFRQTVNHSPVPTLLLAYVAALLLLPSPKVAGLLGNSPLNGPSWSLMQEYLGNIAYALVLRRLRTMTLLKIFIVSGLLLIWVANTKGALDGGWGYRDIWIGSLRVSASFVLGLWLYRIHDHIRVPKAGFLLLSLVLFLCFQMLRLPKIASFSLNGLYDAACVLLVFPLIVLCGAHSVSGPGMTRICKFFGRLSYPIYITHMPFVRVLSNYVSNQHPERVLELAWISAVFLFAVLFAWLAVTLYDEPVRAWLTRCFSNTRREPSAVLK